MRIQRFLHAEFVDSGVVTVVHAPGDGTVVELHVSEHGPSPRVITNWIHHPTRSGRDPESWFEHMCAAALALGTRERDQPLYLH